MATTVLWCPCELVRATMYAVCDVRVVNVGDGCVGDEQTVNLLYLYKEKVNGEQ